MCTGEPKVEGGLEKGMLAACGCAETVAFLSSKAQYQSVKLRAMSTTRQSPWVEAAGRRGHHIR